MLTNFKTIQSRIARLKAIETMAEDGTFDVLPKKEVIELKKELGETGEEPWRYQRNEEDPGCDLHRRSEEGKNLCTGSTYSGYSADRYRQIPTVIRKSWIMSFRVTMMRSEP